MKRLQCVRATLYRVSEQLTIVCSQEAPRSDFASVYHVKFFQTSKWVSRRWIEEKTVPEEKKSLPASQAITKLSLTLHLNI